VVALAIHSGGTSGSPSRLQSLRLGMEACLGPERSLFLLSRHVTYCRGKFQDQALLWEASLVEQLRASIHLRRHVRIVESMLPSSLVPRRWRSPDSVIASCAAGDIFVSEYHKNNQTRMEGWQKRPVCPFDSRHPASALSAIITPTISSSRLHHFDDPTGSTSPISPLSSSFRERGEVGMSLHTSGTGGKKSGAMGLPFT
jgi:hypothetical protein